EEAKAALGIRLPLVSGHRLWRWQLGLVQFVRREDETTVLVDKGLTGRDPRSESSYDVVDDLVGLCLRAGSPPLPIAWRGADGALVEKRGLQVVDKMCQGLLGIRFTGKGGEAQLLERLDFAVTLPAPLRIDGALGLWLALFRVDKDPALRHTAVARSHDRIAIALCQRGHGCRLRLGEDLLSFSQGRGDAGDPLQAGLGERVQIVGAIEGTVGHERRGGACGVA